MDNKKGQAAVEYLATYGWALLILAIVIAAILAMGVFNPNYFVIEECYLGPSFNCHAQLVGEATQTRLLLNISQALGYPAKVKNMTFYSENLGSASIDLDAFMNSSDSKVLEAVFPKPSFKGTVKKITVNLTYYICAEEINPSCDCNSTFRRTISGNFVI